MVCSSTLTLIIYHDLSIMIIYHDTLSGALMLANLLVWILTLSDLSLILIDTVLLATVVLITIIWRRYAH